ncbi:VOC family protein [Azorhizobium doebereinerae]|uniref:VOC family protein n=1 Tax=Azorhizobium doebereinerae TaxID=281091 RepID=UPI000420AC5D|nr:VOC family protein [Azorhizobium doebereinerae]
MSPTHGRFAWYQLATTDTQAAGTFYETVVGWTGRDAGVGDLSYTLLAAKGVDVGGMMTLSAELAQAGVPPHWMGYVEVDDVDASTAKAASLGATIHAEAHDIPDVGRFAVLADPQGAVFALIRWFDGKGPPVTAPGTMGAVGWHELMATDWQAVFPFYAELFGWTKGEAMDMGPMGTYQLFNHDGQSIGGMFTKPPAVPAPFWLFYAQVPAIDAAVKAITAAGGAIMTGPTEVPGGAWIVQARDPQGAMFAVVAPPAGAGCAA